MNLLIETFARKVTYGVLPSCNHLLPSSSSSSASSSSVSFIDCSRMWELGSEKRVQQDTRITADLPKRFPLNPLIVHCKEREKKDRPLIDDLANTLSKVREDPDSYIIENYPTAVTLLSFCSL